MDFATISTSTIDTSPHPSVKQITLLFDEQELCEATSSQFERFFRVWFTDTKEYAPRLTSLIVVLRSGLRNNTVVNDGVQNFLKYFLDYVVHNVSDLKYDIYMDNYASASRCERRQIMDSPIRLRGSASV